MTKLRVLAVADEESKYIWDYFDRSVFRGIDLILACGDLKPAYLSFLTTMVAAPLFYVHGNHDGRMIKTPPEGCDNLETKMQVFKGVRFIGFGGANSRSPKHFHYTDADVARQVVKRMQEISFHGGFDVLVTHSPALAWETARILSIRALQPIKPCWTSTGPFTISMGTST